MTRDSTVEAKGEWAPSGVHDAGGPADRSVTMAMPKDFIDTNDLTKEQILAIEELAIAMK